jgi:hypothetical protein
MIIRKLAEILSLEDGIILSIEVGESNTDRELRGIQSGSRRVDLRQSLADDMAKLFWRWW